MDISKKRVVPQCCVSVGETDMRQANHCCYLGSKVNSDGRCDQDIKREIAEAKRAFDKMKHFLRNTHISFH